VRRSSTRCAVRSGRRTPSGCGSTRTATSRPAA